MASLLELGQSEYSQDLTQALAASKRGAYLDAMKLCQGILARDPDQPGALRHLAHVSLAVGQRELSVKFWRLFVETRQDRAEHWQEFGKLLTQVEGADDGPLTFTCDLTAAAELANYSCCLYEAVEGQLTIPSTALPTDSLPQLASPVEYETRSRYLLHTSDAVITPNFLPIIADNKLVQVGLSLFPIRRALSPAVLSVYPEIVAVSDNHVLIKIPEPTETIEEPVICVSGGPVGPGSYYHWLIDYLTRLWLLDHDGTLRNTRLIVDEALSAFQRDSLEMLGISVDRLINKEEGTSLRCLNLIAPSFCTQKANAFPEAVRFIRSHYLGPTGGERKPTRRLYISRRKAAARRLINEAEVEDYLVQHGFEIVTAENLCLAEQIETFRSAQIVVGPHGAGFANIVFAPSSCSVVEIVTKPDHSIFNLASVLGLPHRHVCTENLGGTVEDAPLDSDSSTYRVSMLHLDHLMTEALSQL